MSSDILDTFVTQCPFNMIYGSCNSQPTCGNPNGTNTCLIYGGERESCICADGFLKKGDECVSPNECSCYVTEIHQVIPVSNMRIC